jgi:hypothetical protein
MSDPSGRTSPPPPSGRPGRPRSGAPLHMVVMREVGNAMRQIRSAAGFEQLDTAAEAINGAIDQLYPDAASPASVRTTVSQPHKITGRYLSDLERGNTNKLPPPDWLRPGDPYTAGQLRSGHIPSWLVRAYDVAFSADGYLVDLYRWAMVLQADQDRIPPRAAPTRQLTRVGVLGYDHALRPFDGASPVIRDLLRQHRERLSSYPGESPTPNAWTPDPDDRSTNINDPVQDIPEGVPVPPGSFLAGRWVLRNAGQARWKHRLFVRVGRWDVGLATPPFAPVPDTDPGHDAEIFMPVKAASKPGTYRLCCRLAWPDGTYCYPNTLVGAIMTVVVLTEDYRTCERSWPVQ